MGENSGKVRSRSMPCSACPPRPPFQCWGVLSPRYFFVADIARLCGKRALNIEMGGAGGDASTTIPAISSRPWTPENLERAL